MVMLALLCLYDNSFYSFWPYKSFLESNLKFSFAIKYIRYIMQLNNTSRHQIDYLKIVTKITIYTNTRNEY